MKLEKLSLPIPYSKKFMKTYYKWTTEKGWAQIPCHKKWENKKNADTKSLPPKSHTYKTDKNYIQENVKYHSKSELEKLRNQMLEIRKDFEVKEKIISERKPNEEQSWDSIHNR